MDFKRAKIIACKAMPNYCIWIQFDDGLEGEIDLSHLVGQGIFEAWKSIDFFNQVRIDHQSNTISWGDDIDLDPYVLREKVEKQANHAKENDPKE
ncbi:MAG: DUF2442 domain-containing protein [Chlamydiales bacterium]|nr:DUF2442 domain-containing protein [Chlamydiales bacterium]